MITAESSSMPPETVRAMGEAFDAAWASIEENFRGNPEQIEAARLTLAKAVLSVGSEGSRDVEELKNAALQTMALRYRDKLRSEGNEVGSDHRSV